VSHFVAFCLNFIILFIISPSISVFLLILSFSKDKKILKHTSNLFPKKFPVYVYLWYN